MSTKQTLSLSKRFVFGVLGLAFILIVVSSLLTLASSRKLARTLDELDKHQQLLTDIESLPTEFDNLLHAARTFARTRLPGDLAALDHALAEWSHWDASPPSLSTRADTRDALDHISQIITETTATLSGLTARAGTGQGLGVSDIWIQIEDDMPGPRLHQLTATLTKAVRQDFRDQARQGAQTATAYQRTGMGFVLLAVILGVLSAILLNRRLQELETFITVCAWTKRVKHEGRWIPFDEFLEKRFRLKLSHGISDEAAMMELERQDPEAAPD